MQEAGFSTTQVAQRDRTGRRITSVERYMVAIVAAALALAAQLALHWLISPNFYPIFLVAVAFSAWYGGFWPGVLTMVLAILGALLVPGPPARSVDVGEGAELMRLLVYGLSGLVVSWLIASLLVARRRAERAAARTARMQALNLSLAPALPVAEVARVLLRHAIDAMQAGAGALALDETDGGEV